MLVTPLLRSTLLAVIVVLSACGADDAKDTAGSDDGKAAGAEGDTVAIEKFVFGPEKLTVAPGTTVTWTNKDEAAHTVKAKAGTAGAAQFDSDNLNKDDTFEHTFEEAGEFAYFCEIHQYMTATVVVEG